MTTAWSSAVLDEDLDACMHVEGDQSCPGRAYLSPRSSSSQSDAHVGTLTVLRNRERRIALLHRFAAVTMRSSKLGDMPLPVVSISKVNTTTPSRGSARGSNDILDPPSNDLPRQVLHTSSLRRTSTSFGTSVSQQMSRAPRLVYARLKFRLAFELLCAPQRRKRAPPRAFRGELIGALCNAAFWP